MRFGDYMHFSVLNIITMVISMDLQQRKEVPAPAGPDYKQPFEERCFCSEAEAEHRCAEVPRLPLGWVASEATELSPGCRAMIENWEQHPPDRVHRRFPHVSRELCPNLIYKAESPALVFQKPQRQNTVPEEKAVVASGRQPEGACLRVWSFLGALSQDMLWGAPLQPAPSFFISFPNGSWVPSKA